ncbi:hypothetical protein ACLBWP_02495 [Microbacterium sp. M1A1_1b]
MTKRPVITVASIAGLTMATLAVGLPAVANAAPNPTVRIASIGGETVYDDYASPLDPDERGSALFTGARPEITAEVGAPVRRLEIRDETTHALICSTTVSVGAGTASCTATTAFGWGTNPIEAVGLNAAGSVEGTSIGVDAIRELDTPTIDISAFDADQHTATVSGTGVPGAEYQVRFDSDRSVVVASGTIAANGTWTEDVAGAQAGDRPYVMTELNGASNHRFGALFGGEGAEPIVATLAPGATDPGFTVPGSTVEPIVAVPAPGATDTGFTAPGTESSSGVGAPVVSEVTLGQQSGWLTVVGTVPSGGTATIEDAHGTSVGILTSRSSHDGTDDVRFAVSAPESGAEYSLVSTSDRGTSRTSFTAPVIPEFGAATVSDLSIDDSSGHSYLHAIAHLPSAGMFEVLDADGKVVSSRVGNGNVTGGDVQFGIMNATPGAEYTLRLSDMQGTKTVDTVFRAPGGDVAKPNPGETDPGFTAPGSGETEQPIVAKPNPGETDPGFTAPAAGQPAPITASDPHYVGQNLDVTLAVPGAGEYSVKDPSGTTVAGGGVYRDLPTSFTMQVPNPPVSTTYTIEFTSTAGTVSTTFTTPDTKPEPPASLAGTVTVDGFDEATGALTVSGKVNDPFAHVTVRVLRAGHEIAAPVRPRMNQDGTWTADVAGARKGDTVRVLMVANTVLVHAETTV